MIFLCQNDVLGPLTLSEVFVYYDGPRLFLAENPAGQRFLVSCVDQDTETEIWLLAAISERRTFSLKDGSLSLREAFTNPELGYVFEITTDNKGELRKSTTRDPKELRSDELPEEGVLLHVQSRDDVSVNAPFLARTLNASIVLLHLYPTKPLKEAPAKEVGHILSSFENYLALKLENALIGASDIGHRLKKQLQQGFQVNVVGTFAGSFGVEIAVRGSDTRIGAALKSAVADLSAAEETPAFRERMAHADDDEVGAMRRFMSEIAKAKSGLRLETASQTDLDSFRADVSLPQLKSALEALRRAPIARTQTRMLVVQLVGLNLRTRKFELVDIETEQRIIGSMVAPLFNDLKKAELPSRYRVVIEGDVRESLARRDEIISNYRMIAATKLAG